MNTGEQRSFFKRHKIMKFFQMTVLIILEITFFLFIITHPSLRNSIYNNFNLFALSAMMWFLMIFSFACLLYDFIKLEKTAKNTYYLSKLANLDEMTGIPNRRGCDLMFQFYCSENSLGEVGCGIMEISNLEEINKTQGYEAGDAAVQDFCSTLSRLKSSPGFVGRNSGNQFLIVLEHCDAKKMDSFFNTLNNEIALYNKEKSHQKINFNYAYVLNSELCADKFSEIITQAYNKLHHLP